MCKTLFIEIHNFSFLSLHFYFTDDCMHTIKCKYNKPRLQQLLCAQTLKELGPICLEYVVPSVILKMRMLAS